jgi:hypothetical protein
MDMLLQGLHEMLEPIGLPFLSFGAARVLGQALCCCCSLWADNAGRAS